jgi:hypothetical protein
VKTLPTNFGDIARYNQRIATRFYLQALIERNCGKNCEAEYHAQLAVRYLEAAQEQTIAMTRPPGYTTEDRRPRPWTLEPSSTPLAANCWTAVRRFSGKMASAIRQSISRREIPFQGLSLN